MGSTITINGCSVDEIPGEEDAPAAPVQYVFPEAQFEGVNFPRSCSEETKIPGFK